MPEKKLHPLPWWERAEDGEAKFWLEPITSFAVSHGLNPRRLKGIQNIVEEHRDEIIKAWQKHFSKR
ncbi:MAG: DUF4160 domain-containing protein [Deltaproteobacteria bacterium]|nr:DUF4160 domain-containing protein [Deltaproteobacteria bacterium]